MTQSQRQRQRDSFAAEIMACDDADKLTKLAALLYGRQTPDEQRKGITCHNNAKGAGTHQAARITAIANGELLPTSLKARKALAFHASQLLTIIGE